MGKHKRKLTTAEKAAKKRRSAEYMTIFVRGKQKRIKRPPTVDGMDADEFIRQNADPIWLHQNEMWEYMDWPKQPGREESGKKDVSPLSSDGAGPHGDHEDDDIPF